jgi:ABC-2 type transport system permease protein
VFGEFLRFELRYQLRYPLIWIAALVFAFMGFLAMTSDFVQIGGAIGNVHLNSPDVIITFMSVFSVVGTFVAIATLGQPLLRDAEIGADELFFSTPMRKFGYLWGRITAGLLASVVVYVIAALTLIVGSFMPWLDPQRLGPFTLTPYLWVLGVIIVPNLLFLAALMSLLAVTTRRLLGVVIGALGFLVLWFIASALTSDIKYDTIVSLIDPFAAQTIDRAMRYWSVNERNTQLPDLSGLLLMNRLLWLGISAALIVAAHALFRPQRAGTAKKWWQRSRAAAAPDTAAAAPRALATLSASPPRSFSTGVALRQLLTQARFDTVAVMKSVPFLVLVGFGLLNFLGGANVVDSQFGTKIYPVTALMFDAMRGSYQFLLALIVIYYAGEVIWKERDAKLAEVTDSMPVPNWVPLLAKTTTMFAVVLAFMLAGVVASILFQLANGYTNLEPRQYFLTALIDSVPFLLMAVLAVFLQVVSNQKFLGYLLVILGLIAQIVLASVNLEHNLYLYPAAPEVTYSDMNGFGHFLVGWGWFRAYWTVFAAMLLILAAAFWVRGVAPSFRVRWRHAMNYLRGPQGALLGALALVFIAIGSWVFYNTNVLNEYLPGDAVLDRQADYEKQYRKYKDMPLPRIADVRADVDIYPQERRVEIRGHYRLVNDHAAPLTELHVSMLPLAELQVDSLPPSALTMHDEKGGYRIYNLPEPIPPGGELAFHFTVRRADRGFTFNGMPASRGGGDLRSQVNYNGTFFNSGDMMPHFGYDSSVQILDRNERRKRGLGDVPRAAKLEDESARNSIGFADSGWINFETTVSTTPDQIALAPGYLQREWTEGGRRYFHYKMDGPMLPYYCFLSADWEVKRGEWRGLPIEIYYDAKHPYNVDRMIVAAQESLDYFSANFSPYQHKQVRILEFPRYARFAQSFANTIPYSESIGFIADLRDPDDIDYVYYVTAHEVAHQWWAHQVIGADVQGQSMIVESLAQYSALMVMEKEYGREHMRRFLKYELDEYLSGRGGEIIEELPLMRVENQPYIHYNKGSLIFYRLREAIGEDKVNRALAAYVRDKAFQKPPYTTTLEMLDYIRAEAGPEQHTMIDELFAKIVLYDNRIVAARSKQREDGRYDIEIDFEAQKRESDGSGREQPLTLDDWMEVAVFARAPGQSEREEKPLYMKPHRITEPRGTLKLVVDSAPYEVGLDPYNKLIDRIPDDNRKTL